MEKHSPIAHLSGREKHVADVGAIAILFGSFADYLPAIAAGLSALWMLIRIYETPTVQKIIAWVRGKAVDSEKSE